MVHSDNGVLFSAIKKRTIKPWKGMEKEHYTIITKWEKLIWKGYIPCDSNYLALWKKQNSRDSKEMSGCQSL